jgi:hypothetical protein
MIGFNTRIVSELQPVKKLLQAASHRGTHPAFKKICELDDGSKAMLTRVIGEINTEI